MRGDDDTEGCRLITYAASAVEHHDDFGPKLPLRSAQLFLCNSPWPSERVRGADLLIVESDFIGEKPGAESSGIEIRVLSLEPPDTIRSSLLECRRETNLAERKFTRCHTILVQDIKARARGMVDLTTLSSFLYALCEGFGSCGPDMHSVIFHAGGSEMNSPCRQRDKRMVFAMELQTKVYRCHDITA